MGNKTQIPVNYKTEELITIKRNHEDLILELNMIALEKLRSQKNVRIITFGGKKTKRFRSKSKRLRFFVR